MVSGLRFSGQGYLVIKCNGNSIISGGKVLESERWGLGLELKAVR